MVEAVIGHAPTFAVLVRAGVLEVGDGYRAKNEELGGSGPIFLRAAYLQDIGFRLDQPDRFLTTDVRSFGPKVARLGDVVITTKGNSTGRVGRIGKGQAGTIYSPHLSYWRSCDHAILDQTFLYYWSRSAEFRQQLSGMAASTDMAPYLSLRDQMRLRITLPSIEVQSAMGDLLGALDDKIALNARMNATLEAMARAVFEAWFVRFGPVRAKAEGRAPPGLAPDLAALFPDRLTETPDGEVPEGWTMGTLGPLLRINSRSLTAAAAPDSIRYVDISSVERGRLLKAEVMPFSAAPSRARRLVQKGDTIWSCVRPNHAAYLLIQDPPRDLVVSTGFAVLTPARAQDRAFCYLASTNEAAVAWLTARADGAAYPAVRPGEFGNLPAALVPEVFRDALEEAVGPLLDRVSANAREDETLSALRDLLLPRLISGKLRLRDAERVVEAAL